MERWVPLFDIFLNSPSPEGEASMWLQQQQHLHHPHQSKPPHSPNPTSAFLSQLMSPAEVIVPNHPTDAASPPTIKRCLWMQTLPYAVQSRILSFLAFENQRFCSRMLRSLATQVLDYSVEDGGRRQEEEEGEQFWVARAARYLLDTISARDLWLAGEPEEEVVQIEEDEDEGWDDDFDSLPPWLQNTAAATCPVFPWLPLPRRQLRRRTRIINASLDVAEAEDSATVGEPGETMEEAGEVLVETQLGAQTLSTQILERVSALKEELLSMDSASDALHICGAIKQLCLEAGEGRGAGNCLAVLSLVEPWEAGEETALALLSHLLVNSKLEHYDWPSHAFSAVLLPKLLILQKPASRVLLSSVIDFCKTHPKMVMIALLFPLIYRKEGINTPLSDVLARIMKECMHPSHVSAFCQRLLCEDRVKGDIVCLPCHRHMISNELVWTESLFSLFQRILSWDVPLTPDSVDKLISVLQGLGVKFSKSLKFGSFLLSLVTKSEHALKFHRISLMRIAEKTGTFVTNSIISKLEDK